MIERTECNNTVLTNQTNSESMTLEDAGALLRRWQLNEWALDKKMTKKALREQRQIITILLTKLCQRYVADVEVDHILNSMN
jgi:hypothetical protein